MRGLISILLFLCMSVVSLAEIKTIRVMRSPPVKKIAVSKTVSKPTMATTVVTPEQASVQVRVHNRGIDSRGSGTAISPKEVLTCWHIFREPGAVTVNGKPAKLLRKDEISDVALVEIEPELAKKEPLNFLSIAKEPPKKGESVTAYGYEYNRTGLWKFPTRITAVNRYTGFDNVSIAGRPNQGRSGGGLFNEQGELVGVCSASDGGEGLYCGLEAISNLLKSETVTKPTVPKSGLVETAAQASVAAGAVQSCPDGKCPLQKKQPTLAPHVIEPAQPRPVLRSVMKPVQRVVQAQPVRRVAGRLFSGRLFGGRLFGRCR